MQGRSCTLSIGRARHARRRVPVTAAVAIAVVVERAAEPVAELHQIVEQLSHTTTIHSSRSRVRDTMYGQWLRARSRSRLAYLRQYERQQTPELLQVVLQRRACEQHTAAMAHLQQGPVQHRQPSAAAYRLGSGNVGEGKARRLAEGRSTCFSAGELRRQLGRPTPWPLAPRAADAGLARAGREW